VAPSSLTCTQTEALCEPNAGTQSLCLEHGVLVMVAALIETTTMASTAIETNIVFVVEKV
jgi:hypothetical protein